MKKILVLLLAASSVIAISSCDKSSSSPSTNAKVMFVNGCSGTSPLGLSINGTDMPNASSVAYLDSSGYQTVSSGTVNCIIFTASNLNALTTFSTIFTAGDDYSIFAGGLSNKDSVFITLDDLTKPTGSNAEIRLVNTCPDALSSSIGGIAVSATTGANTTFASGVAYQSASGFSTIPAGSYIMKVEGDTLSTEQNTGTVQLNAGKIYTVMYSGKSPIYNLTVIANN